MRDDYKADPAYGVAVATGLGLADDQFNRNPIDEAAARPSSAK